MLHNNNPNALEAKTVGFKQIQIPKCQDTDLKEKN